MLMIEGEATCNQLQHYSWGEILSTRGCVERHGPSMGEDSIADVPFARRERKPKPEQRGTP